MVKPEPTYTVHEVEITALCLWCVFCGSNYACNSTNNGGFSVRCLACGAMGPVTTSQLEARLLFNYPGRARPCQRLDMSHEDTVHALDAYRDSPWMDTAKPHK